MSDEENTSKREIIKRGLNTKQAAERIGVTPKTLHNYRSLETGPNYWKLGNAIIYDPIDLDDYLDQKMSKVMTTYYAVGGIHGPFKGYLDDVPAAE